MVVLIHFRVSYCFIIITEKHIITYEPYVSQTADILGLRGLSTRAPFTQYRCTSVARIGYFSALRYVSCHPMTFQFTFSSGYVFFG